MKKLTSLIFLALIFSCGGNSSEDAKSENILQNLSYSVDTVLVDAGEDFLNLSRGISIQSLSDDLTRLYFFERDPYKLVEIDLDQLKVINKTVFETEGPDGVGNYLSNLAVGPEGELFLKSNSVVGIFDQKAKKLQNLKVLPSGIDSTLAKNSSALYSNVVYDFGTQKIFSHPYFRDAGDNLLLIIDPKTTSATSLPVPKMKIVDDYTGTFTFESENGTAIAFYFVGSFITLLPEELILSTSAMSGFYKLNTQTQKLEFIEVQHQTVPNQIQVEIPQNPSGVEEVRKIQNEIFASVNFLEFKRDDTRQLYFRLGERTFRGETREDPIKYEYHLFAYDKDFNVLGETKLEGVDFALMNTFFKDGKLWSYVNVEDELGFAVFDFKF
ncbi:DUF4221 family protein [Algoriphagus sp.]|uniref:DUF4221 family protein n=1 Tax=Algoriphagus sp. TaxID=1872435 RepID=UPI002621D612|nr:DUF4221 family protein [Algoriphagus sp.]